MGILLRYTLAFEVFSRRLFRQVSPSQRGGKISDVIPPGGLCRVKSQEFLDHVGNTNWYRSQVGCLNVDSEYRHRVSASRRENSVSPEHPERVPPSTLELQGRLNS